MYMVAMVKSYTCNRKKTEAVAGSGRVLVVVSVDMPPLRRSTRSLDTESINRSRSTAQHTALPRDTRLAPPRGTTVPAKEERAFSQKNQNQHPTPVRQKYTTMLQGFKLTNTCHPGTHSSRWIGHRVSTIGKVRLAFVHVEP